MVPKPQEPNPGAAVASGDGDRVVISGMSGLFPKCHNVKEFSELLYNKVNPITSEAKHWSYSHPEVAQYMGIVPELDRFDAQFFKVHFRLGNSMDSMSRKMLEQSYQAIYDAGLSPEHLSGKKIGVFVGSCFSETEKAAFYVATSRTGFGLVGCSKAMFANRISYWLNAKGPSVGMDEACCSSIAALEQGCQAISRGDCEAAIIGGANLCLHPQSSVHYSRIMNICLDGKTKVFDENADGVAKSEAINVLFLQKAKDALRVYADVIQVKSVFLSHPQNTIASQFGFYRNPERLSKFLKSFYEEVNVPPEEIEYVEAFGAAVPDADKAELEAFGEVFCKNRKDKLLVGSVMSNIGYGEAASGISSITKVLIGYQKGEIAANLHCSNPRKDVVALKEDRMRIVTEHKPFKRTYTAINNLSVTGCVAHVLLQGKHKPKDLNRYKSSIPHLVTISGRQESAVKKILNDLKSRPIDPEELALFHNIHSLNIPGHLGRGFTILHTNAEQKTVSLVEKCEYFDNARRPLWFVYSGMGSQWPAMGAHLMRIPIFAAAIKRCQRALQPKGIDVVQIITSPNKDTFNNILHSFVGIAAVQIGLTDVMMQLGLVPDKIIGHSVGELGCAYADGCLTAEEMILSAYSRGLVSVQTPLIRGSMAAVGIGYEEMAKMIPPEIEVACHNSSESSTISGPADLMREFVASLTAKGIFAKEVPCSNIAYHSRYIADAGPGLLKYLTEVIRTPKLRSERWISTSVPQNRWHEDLAKYSSAQYHTNNLLSPVLFEETSKLIPLDAVLVEIAPHGLLQAILKRSLPESCNNIPLTRRGHPDNALMVLEGIGKLFMEGYNPKLEVLYPKIEFPVSTGTPMLSHLVEWAHHEKWVLPLYVSAHRKTAAAAKFVISVQDDECNYLQGHVVKGKNVYPFSAAVVAVWDTLAMSLGEQRKQISVEFRDLRFFSQPILHNQRQLQLNVALHRGTGRFEVMDEDSKVITGYISPSSSYYFDINATSQSEKMSLDSENIYEMFYEREYSYSGDFHNIHSANTSLTEAHLYWNNNWVTIIDGMLQLNALKRKHGGVSQPAMIRRMCVDIQEHLLTEMVMMNGKPTMKACLSEMFDRTICGGIVIENIKFNDLPLNYLKNVSMKALKFVPYFQSIQSDVPTTLLIYLQMAAENMNKNALNIIEICNTPDGSSTTTFSKIKYLTDEISGLKLTFQKMYVGVKMQERRRHLDNVDLLLVQNFSLDDSLYQMLYSTIQRDVFLVSAEKIPHEKLRTRPSTSCRIVASQNSGETYLHLYRLNPKPVEMSTTSVTVRTQKDLDMLLTTRDKLPLNHKLIVLSSYPPLDGVKELVTLWRKDLIRNQINLVMLNHKIAKEQGLDQMPETKLAFNILDHGTWGGEYYVPMVQEKSVVPQMMLQSEQIGNLDALRWVETPSVKSSGVTVTVHYAGLTSMDAKRALGSYPKMSDDNFNYNSYGMDFSGVTDSGVQVMGLVRGGSASNRVSAVPELLWPVPKHWTLEDAATVPMAYVHAFYCLFVRSYFKPKGSILVHGGSGALGQAVISIALAHGLNVFATVSDIRKKHFLRKLFPDLKEDHIGNSRDTSFRDMVINLTNGVGADCIINCVKGELKHMSLKTASTCGITLDTTQLQSNEVFSLGMSRLMCDRNYVTVDFCSIFNESNYIEMKKLQLLVSEGIARGYVRPLSRVTYSPLESARAFRLLEASQHRGRVLLKLTDTPLTARPRLTCSSSQSHVIISDDESVGVQLADRMVSCGARKILLQMNSLPTHVLLKKQSWQSLEAEVKILTENIISKNINTLLNEATKMAPIEGIYLVSTSADSKTKQDILTALDVYTRKLGPQLKYFAVITTDKSFGNHVCISRAQDRLPVTKLDLPAVKKMDDIEITTDVGVCARDVCDALEKALRSPHTLTLAHAHHGVKQTLLQKIAAVTNIKIPASVSTTSCLQDLGISYEKSFAIAALFRNEHGLWLSEDQILSLDVRRIHEIEKITVGTDMREVKGFDVFYSHIDTDELIATTDMVFLPTLTSSAAMRDDEFDVNQTYLCIVPGLEGHYERFRRLCERIKVPAIVLQPGLDRPNESIRQMAEKYTQILLRKAALKTNYYLVGYESGVMVALEMAAILEDQGLTGTVYCIGTAPDQLKLLLENELKFESEEALQEALLRRMFSLMIGDDSTLEFAKHSTWQEKIETCVRALLGRVPHSAQYAKAQFETAYGRILQVRQYNPKPRLMKAKLVLLHTTTPGVQNQPIADAEFLQQYSEQPIAVHEMNAPLAHVLKDLRCAAIINQYLDPDILEEFNMKNLCETYLLNADTFMTSEESSD